MKKLLSVLLFAPLVLFGQEPISYQLSSGWNMVGYTGTAYNNGIVEQMDAALGNGAVLSH